MGFGPSRASYRQSRLERRSYQAIGRARSGILAAIRPGARLLPANRRYAAAAVWFRTARVAASTTSSSAR